MVVLVAAQAIKSDLPSRRQHGRLDHNELFRFAVPLRRSAESDAPVMAVEGPQPQGLAVALNDQAVAVVLDLVDPFRPVRNRRARIGCKFERRIWACALPGTRLLALAELRYPHLDRHKVVHSIDGECHRSSLADSHPKPASRRASRASPSVKALMSFSRSSREVSGCAVSLSGRLLRA